MLPAPHRMRAGTEFEAAVRRGRRAGSPRVVVHTSTSAVPDGPRVGFVVSKAVGGSVVRHRVARRLRETVRPHLGAIAADRLVVLRAQPASATASYAELEADVTRLLDRLGVVRAAAPDRAAGGAP
ncbi:ribonuclease P protein component [Kineosporia sp. R_H_3]|uniref:ribonuclease P protein component n=1 Tax=Kineosporia sp. R_H_3 TaxID=1961848 RepID=UPI000B4B6AF2|nr:ribonuclease P protein component [Kineosporia sp. R_H_3]